MRVFATLVTGENVQLYYRDLTNLHQFLTSFKTNGYCEIIRYGKNEMVTWHSVVSIQWD